MKPHPLGRFADLRNPPRRIPPGAWIIPGFVVGAALWVVIIAVIRGLI
jgi:hypothetical protein